MTFAVELVLGTLWFGAALWFYFYPVVVRHKLDTTERETPFMQALKWAHARWRERGKSSPPPAPACSQACLKKFPLSESELQLHEPHECGTVA